MLLWLWVSSTAPRGREGRVIALAAQAGRCCLQVDRQMQKVSSLTWDEGEPWCFGMEMRRNPAGDWEASGVLRRGEDRIELKDTVLITPGGVVFTRDKAAPVLPGTRPLNPFFISGHRGQSRRRGKELGRISGGFAELARRAESGGSRGYTI